MTLLGLSQVAEILSNELGKKISYIEITGEDVRKGMKKMAILMP
jgi:hypothetical protein